MDGGPGVPGPGFVDRLRGGFTLIELLVILAVVSILMTITISTIDTRRFQLDSAVKEVRAVVTTSRGRALLQQHDIVVTFNVADHLLFVLDDANNNRSADSGERKRTVPLGDDVRFDRGGADAIQGVNDAVSFTKKSETLPALTFHRNGAASEEGIIYVTSARAAGRDEFPQDTRALLVERATGRIRCLSYRTRQWVEGC